MGGALLTHDQCEAIIDRCDKINAAATRLNTRITELEAEVKELKEDVVLQRYLKDQTIQVMREMFGLSPKEAKAQLIARPSCDETALCDFYKRVVEAVDVHNRDPDEHTDYEFFCDVEVAIQIYEDDMAVKTNESKQSTPKENPKDASNTD